MITFHVKRHFRKRIDVKQMKFFNFSELGSCCRPHVPDAPEESGSHETWKRSRCAVAVHWRPALPAISEDGVVAQVGAGKSKQMVQKQFQAKGGSMAKNHKYSSTIASTESRGLYEWKETGEKSSIVSATVAAAVPDGALV